MVGLGGRDIESLTPEEKVSSSRETNASREGSRGDGTDRSGLLCLQAILTARIKRVQMAQAEAQAKMAQVHMQQQIHMQQQGRQG